jgi:hypothetical protein
MDSQRCSACKHTKPVSMFYKSSANKYTYRCKACFIDAKNERVRISKEWVSSYKKERGCRRCGYSIETHPHFVVQALEFHHTKNDKKYSVSRAVNSGASLTNVIKEALKCELLCSRCHKEVHYRIL